MNSQYAFNRAFDSIDNSIEFQESWNNGTGYFDPIVHNGPRLVIGEQVKSETANGRRLIVTGTPVGNLVVFERYSADDSGRSPVIVYNSPDSLRAILGGTSLSESQVMLALGGPGYDNLGKIVERLIDVARKSGR